MKFKTRLTADCLDYSDASSDFEILSSFEDSGFGF